MACVRQQVAKQGIRLCTLAQPFQRLGRVKSHFGISANAHFLEVALEICSSEPMSSGCSLLAHSGVRTAKPIMDVTSVCEQMHRFAQIDIHYWLGCAYA